MVDWLFKNEDPVYSYWHMWVDGSEKPKKFYSKACYATLWDLFEQKDVNKLMVFHPYKAEVDQDISVVDALLNLPGFEEAFITKDAKEGLEKGFEINTQISLGLLKASTISLRAIFENPTFVTDYNAFVSAGIPPEEAVVYPFKFRSQVGVFNFGYEQHWSGLPSNVSVPDILNKRTKNCRRAFDVFGSAKEAYNDLKKHGIDFIDEWSFFGACFIGYKLDKDNCKKLRNLVMEGMI